MVIAVLVHMTMLENQAGRGAEINATLGCMGLPQYQGEIGRTGKQSECLKRQERGIGNPNHTARQVGNDAWKLDKGGIRIWNNVARQGWN